MNLDKEKYLKVRMAQGQGARTIDELKSMTDIVIENDTELNEIENLLKNACKCRNVTIQEIVNPVNNGADTVEKVKESTGATTGFCHGSRCKGKIEELIAKYK